MNIKLISAVILGLTLPWAMFSETAFEAGLRLLKEDKPQEARAMLENALVGETHNEKVYYYLGIVYQQLAQPEKAIDVLQKGLLVAQDLKPVLLYQIGVNYEAKKDFTLAEKFYTMAIAENGLLARAYLNRANTRMELIHYKDAVEDYRTYLRLRPDAPQRPEIERLLALLEQDFAQQENLLRNVLNSLKNASLDAETTSAGIEEFKDTGTTDVDILD
ncbi:MAG TPA: tetratricopeptide repeat protein [Spirochaetia bacterium]|nr:tetratricopeptide repeat protein [Spirochaetia bacterium]